MTFTEYWTAFLQGVENTIRDKEAYNGLDEDRVLNLVEEVMAELRADDAVHDVRRAAQELDETTRDLLTKEIRLWNDSVDTEPREDSPDRFYGDDHGSSNGNPDMRLNQAQTVKDSVEQLLSLPSWLSKPLKILNEVLSLIT
ncbi:MAG: hypothetical protein ABEH90_01055 [Halolamina sp.]